MTTINKCLAQADHLRFKLLAITGKDSYKKDKIINYLESEKWSLVNVGKELIEITGNLESSNEKVELELVTKIKEWFNSKPNYLVLTNASILYHDIFLKMSPVGAFKYNSRNKNCVIFLEDETRLGNRLYFGDTGSDDYYDQDIRDIVMVDIHDIDDIFVKQEKEEFILDQAKLGKDTIGKLFQFQQIKDVIDIDSDIKELKSRVEIVSSYVISSSLEKQICEFFENLERPDHKANTIIGNYGSGKSHLISLLVSLISWPDLSKYVKNEKISQTVSNLSRKFYTVQFELQSVQVPLRVWFFDKIIIQLKDKYNIDIPVLDLKTNYDDKENIRSILEVIKKNDSTAGLLVVIDEVSDFLASKKQEQMKADLQFLRVIGQVCMDTDQDIMFIGSMQEDIFSSPKFKNVAAEFSRVAERFIPVIIHREDIQKVISSRIVPKTREQKHQLESKLKPYAEKIDVLSEGVDDFIDLFPLTPFLINAFNELPYFEKRGVIQFAVNEIKYLLNKKFPYFITFERIYDILENSPDKKNLEEIASIAKVMEILKQKIFLIETKYQEDALKIGKALAVYRLWPRHEAGTTSRELANHLMLLPLNKHFSAEDHISLIVSKIRAVTDQQYIKVLKDDNSGIEYFKFATKIGIDPEEKISQKVSSVSDDEVEAEFFIQLYKLLELYQIDGFTDVFEDECEWSSVKSFRQGYIFFCKKYSSFKNIPEKDYSIVFLSPFVNECNSTFSDLELTIKIPLPGARHVERIKEVVAIKTLINNNFQTQLMQKKLEQRLNGYNKGTTEITGVRYSLATLFKNKAEIFLNGKKENLKNYITRSHESVPEILDDLKTSMLDEYFTKKYPLHPKYAIKLSKGNIQKSLSDIASDLIKGNLNDTSANTSTFLRTVDMIDSSGFPNALKSKIASQIFNEISKNQTKVTDIDKEIISRFCTSDYGLEKEFICLVLILLTLQAKIYLQATGGVTIDINNIGDKFKSLAMFETVNYVRCYKKEVSYDFAQRLFHNIGLNGAKLCVDEERANAFNEYKTRIDELISRVKNLDEKIRKMRRKHHVYINMDDIDQYLDDIKELDWSRFDIANHTKFSSIEKYLESKNIDTPKIKLILEKLGNALDALKDYNIFIHSGIAYAEDAVDLLEKNKILITDTDKLLKLTAIKEEMLEICTDSDKFLDRSQRNPLKGKIDLFKKMYIYDFYLPLHKACVGQDLDWKELDTYINTDVFYRLNLLKKLQCISASKLNGKIARWQDLNKYKCISSSLEDQLEQSVKCSRCSFPDNPDDGKYSNLKKEISSIEETLEDFLLQFEDTIIKEIRQYRDNIQYLEDESSKKIILEILSEKQLPEKLDNKLIQDINQLFREIDVVELDSHNDIIEKIFPHGGMITIEDLQKAFLTIEGDIVKNRDKKSIRIKLKND